MLGSTDNSGVISAPAAQVSPAPKTEGQRAHPRAVDAETAGKRLVHDHRPRVQPEAREVEQRRETPRDRQSDCGDDQPIGGIVYVAERKGALERARGELHFAPESQRDQLPDDDAEPPGREDRVERAIIERANDEALDQQTADEAEGQRGWRREPGVSRYRRPAS